MTMTRSGEKCSIQIGTMGQIENLGISNFKLEDGNSFQIKNDGLEVIELDVRLAGMPEGEFVATRFDYGWSTEIVKEVKQTNLPYFNLKWGY